MTQQMIDTREGQLDPAGLHPPFTDRGAQPESRSGRSEAVAVAVLCLLTAGAVALFFAQLHNVDLGDMTGLGLISVLPLSTLLGLGLLTICFIGALSLRRRCAWLLGVQLVLLVVLLHGITIMLETEARCSIAWIHAGFVEFIDRTGTVAPGLDARWSWPGFFALAEFWVGSGDRTALSPILTLTPVVNNLLYLVALGLLLSTVRMSWQARWLAALLFCLLNWIGQDYFSPQGWTYLLYLLFVGFLVAWFLPTQRTSAEAPSPLGPAGRLWRRLWGQTSPGELPARKAGPAERVVLLAVVVGLFTAATVSHQLTPVAMVMSAAGLVLVRRCMLTGLPMLLVVILISWLSFMTYSYWSGHFGDLVGSIGDVGGTVSSSVVARASSGSAEHQLVVYARILTTVLLFLMAGWGLLRRRRRGIEDRVLLVLIAVPIGLALLQSYGGEIALRVYLFALAPACVLGALALFPHPTARPSLLARGAAGGCALVLLFGFFVTRYGNEVYEQMSEGAVAAVETVYEGTSARAEFLYVSENPDPSATISATPFIPVGYRDVERVSFSSVYAPSDAADVSGVLQALREEGPGTYLITTRSQEAYLIFGEGYPMGWGQRFRRALAAAPGVQVVVDNADASVYTLNWLPGEVAKPHAPAPTGVEVRRTPWTPVGVAFLVMLLGILGVREASRARFASDQRRRLRPLTLAAVPLLVGLVLVIVERFVLLTS
jgi:hypothetical protein